MRNRGTTILLTIMIGAMLVFAGFAIKETIWPTPFRTERQNMPLVNPGPILHH